VKDPERLLASSAGEVTDEERRLLLGGDTEEPPKGGATRLLAALAAPMGTSGGTAGGQHAPTHPPPPVTTTLAAKWALVAVGTVALGGALAIVAARGPSTTQHPGSATSAVHAQPAEAPTTEPAPTAAEGVAAPATSAEPARTNPSPVANAPVTAPTSKLRVNLLPRGATPSIAREVESLDAARTRLHLGDARGALSALDQYDADAPRGALSQEATLLRIQALVKAGDPAAARRLGLRFLAAHPGTPHAERVRALIGDGP
jgi:hypothetical protein